MFWNKIKSNEYKELEKRISEIENKISSLSSDVAFYSDKVLRKIRPKRPTEEDEQGDEETPDLEKIKEAFGGSLPIEFMQKYK
jgi:hypothetical protein